MNHDVFADPRWNAFGLLRETYAALEDRIEGELEEAGAPDRALTDLVFRLARSPRRMLRAGEITRALSTTTTRTTRIIDRAEERGLVRRRPDPDDRRALLVELTPHGLEVAREFGPVALDAAQRHLHDRLTPHQTRTLERLLRLLRD
jgi:DNA-binding MarR family transcriptional regulator